MNAGAHTPPCLGPFQDAVVAEALTEMAASIERAVLMVAARRNVDPEDLRDWIATDSMSRAIAQAGAGEA